MPFQTVHTLGVEHPFHYAAEMRMSSARAPRDDHDDIPRLIHSSMLLDARSTDHNEPIPEEEEEEEEDETSSEPAEAITPTSDSHPPFSHHTFSNHGHHDTPDFVPATATVKPLVANASAISTAAGTPNTRLPPNKPPPSMAPGLEHRKSISLKQLFRRSNSHTSNAHASNPIHGQSPTGTVPSDNLPTVLVSKITRRPTSFSLSARHSPVASQSNSPPSPSSPISTVHSSNDKTWEPTMLNKSVKSSTGLGGLRSRLMPGSSQPDSPRKRSTSVNHVHEVAAPGTDGVYTSKDFFSRPAETGAGLKARRMSMNLPDDFVVETGQLEKEFSSASKLPGKRGKNLGKGATATVRLMIRKGNGDEIYAVKEFRKRGQNEDGEEYDKKVKSEFTIAKSLHHPNIVESIRLCAHGGRWNVVMEYCEYGELFSLVEKQYLTFEDNLCLWKQLLRGVNYLHKHGIAHRDIKLENLLMNEKGNLKITDFGVSEVFCGEHPGLRAAGGECGKNMKEVRRCAPGICGSLPYIAPEVLEKKGHYDPRPLDVWSCAIVLLTMMFHGQPWREASRSQPAYAEMADAWHTFQPPQAEVGGPESTVPSNCGRMFKAIKKPALRALILKMLHPVPEKRYRIQDVIKDRWVDMIECCVHDEDDTEATPGIDVSKGSSCKFSSKMVRRTHNHLPPTKNWVPQHRFDLGDGWA